MLTKTKSIREQSKNHFFFQKFKTPPFIWPRGSKDQNLKEIYPIGSEIIDDEKRTTDDRRISISLALLT